MLLFINLFTRVYTVKCSVFVCTVFMTGFNNNVCLKSGQWANLGSPNVSETSWQAEKHANEFNSSVYLHFPFMNLPYNTWLFLSYKPLALFQIWFELKVQSPPSLERT